MKYIYPKLPAYISSPLIRIGGNGLANCLFVYAKAIVYGHCYNLPIITPTWLNLSFGTYLRLQADKRHYYGLFNSNNEISGLRKMWLLAKLQSTTDIKKFIIEKDTNLLIVEGIYDFFKPLIDYHEIIKNYILEHINPKLLEKINNFDFTDTLAVHIRLGDFPINRRIPIDWYISEIKKHKRYNRVLIFSDGQDEELKDLLYLPNMERVFFGGAIQDIIAISRCSYLIGSDSSFSAWGAFLGQVPCSFYRTQFGIILKDSSKQIIVQPS
ncbi:hypothetical protein [Bacteroides acidifaciens]|uniref:hypothetical protein n=1 Tax=Bacteroides acidifaciens TaxID=85831 RepID=UPI0025A93A59|nr:hypothetical protein [Bacteroides acidifaciens]